MNNKVNTNSHFSFVSEEINNSRFRNISISSFLCFFLVGLVGLLRFSVDRPAPVVLMGYLCEGNSES